MRARFSCESLACKTNFVYHLGLDAYSGRCGSLVVLTLATSVRRKELPFYLEHLVTQVKSSMPRKYVECLFYLFLMCLLVSLCVFLLTTPLRPLRSEELSEIEEWLWGRGPENTTKLEGMWVHVLV